jgi:hypothetical protein
MSIKQIDIDELEKFLAVVNISFTDLENHAVRIETLQALIKERDGMKEDLVQIQQLLDKSYDPQEGGSYITILVEAASDVADKYELASKDVTDE